MSLHAHKPVTGIEGQIWSKYNSCFEFLEHLKLYLRSKEGISNKFLLEIEGTSTILGIEILDGTNPNNLKILIEALKKSSTHTEIINKFERDNNVDFLSELDVLLTGVNVKSSIQGIVEVNEGDINEIIKRIDRYIETSKLHSTKGLVFPEVDTIDLQRKIQRIGPVFHRRFLLFLENQPLENARSFLEYISDYAPFIIQEMVHGNSENADRLLKIIFSQKTKIPRISPAIFMEIAAVTPRQLLENIDEMSAVYSPQIPGDLGIIRLIGSIEIFTRMSKGYNDLYEFSEKIISIYQLARDKYIPTENGKDLTKFFGYSMNYIDRKLPPFILSEIRQLEQFLYRGLS